MQDPCTRTRMLWRLTMTPLGLLLSLSLFFTFFLQRWPRYDGDHQIFAIVICIIVAAIPIVAGFTRGGHHEVDISGISGMLMEQYTFCTKCKRTFLLQYYPDFSRREAPAKDIQQVLETYRKAREELEAELKTVDNVKGQMETKNALRRAERIIKYLESSLSQPPFF